LSLLAPFVPGASVPSLRLVADAPGFSLPRKSICYYRNGLKPFGRIAAFRTRRKRSQMKANARKRLWWKWLRCRHGKLPRSARSELPEKLHQIYTIRSLRRRVNGDCAQLQRRCAGSKSNLLL